MNKIKEFVNNMTTRGWITTAIIGALVLIIIVGTIVGVVGHAGKSRFSFTDGKKDVEIVDTDTDDFIDRAKDNVFVRDNPASNWSGNLTTGTQTTPAQPAVSYDAAKREVRIALIIAENEYEVKNVIEGICGNVYMVTAYVPGPSVLGNSYRALFGDKVFGDFLPGNIIPNYHPDLTYRETQIVNGVAKIYLGGSFNTKRDACDTQLAIAQLEETAKNYPNVKSVEIYLGTQKVN